jgi:hypothetical protein
MPIFTKLILARQLFAKNYTTFHGTLTNGLDTDGRRTLSPQQASFNCVKNALNQPRFEKTVAVQREKYT